MSRATDTGDTPTTPRRASGRYDSYGILVCNLSEVVTRGNGAIAGARLTLDRVRRTGIRVELTSKPSTFITDPELDPTRTLVISGSLEDMTVARAFGFDSLFLLGRANGLRDVALCGRQQRPTYVAFDIRTLEHPSPASWPIGQPPSTYTLRGRVVLPRPFRAPPQQILDAVIEAGQRARDRNKIMLGARDELWREPEHTLSDYWTRWVEQQSGSIARSDGLPGPTPPR